MQPIASSPSIASSLLLEYTRVLRDGALRPLSASDLPPLPPALESPACTSRFTSTYASFMCHRSHSLLRFLACTVLQNDFLMLAWLKLVNCVLSFVSPYFMQQLIDHASHEHHAASSAVGAAIALKFTGCLIVQALLANHFDVLNCMLKAKLKSGISNTLARNSINLRMCDQTGREASDVTSMIQVDVDRVCELVTTLNEAWSLPLFIAIAFILLYKYIQEAFLVGILTIVLLIPFNTHVSRCIGQVTEALMIAKDSRLSFLSEALYGMLGVKLQRLEEPVLNVIRQRRDSEFRSLAQRKYLDVVYVYLWAVLPVAVPLSTLIVANYRGVELSVSQVFVAVALLKMLIFPLNSIPFVVNSMVDSAVSLSRISSALRMSNAHDDTSIPHESLLASLSLEDAMFSYGCVSESDETDTTALLSPLSIGPVSLRAHAGDVIGVVGSVGSGKTCLLLGCIGEVNLISGVCTMDSDRISFCSQQHMFIGGTVRENIVLDEPWNALRYATVVKGNWPLRDETRISSAGAGLSGGQRARINLARALYASSKTVVLDDVFSSLDATTSKAVMAFVVHTAVNEQRLVLLSTHSIHLLRAATCVIFLEAGKVTAIGSFNDVIDARANIHSQLTSITTINEPSSIQIDDNTPSDIIPLSDEGGIRWSVISGYFSRVGVSFIVGTMLSIALMQMATISMDLWMAHWSSHSNVISNSLFTRVSILICIALSLSTTARAILFCEGCLRASRLLFDNLICDVMSADMEYFDKTPIGDILNYLGRDTYTIDDELPFSLNAFLAQTFHLLGSVLVLLSAYRAMFLPLLVTMAVFHQIQQFYRLSSREIKRILSTNRSAVYTCLSEMLSNGASIRAQKLTNYFCTRLSAALDKDILLSISSVLLSCWLTVRLRLLYAAMMGCISFALIISQSLGWKALSPQCVGLVLTSALGMMNQLGGLIGSLIILEQQIIAVERVLDVSDKISSTLRIVVHGSPHNSQPADGCVEVSGLGLFYNNLVVIEGASCAIEKGSCVAVVGRTGAGKSTFVKMLARLIDYAGSVRIGGVELSSLSESSMEHTVFVVPQDPLVMSGTIRFNLDPKAQYADVELYRCAQLSGLTLAFQRQAYKGDLLEFQIAEFGGNLSQGQKQLIHISRALLLRVHLLVLDEVTSYLDSFTEKALYSSLLSHATDSTVMIICHKLDSVLPFCDSVLEFGQGTIRHRLISSL